MSTSITVQFKTLQSCLINLPLSLYGPLVEQGIPAQNVVLKLTWSQDTTKESKDGTIKKAYVGWTGALVSNGSYDSKRLGLSTEYIQIDPLFAKEIGIREDQKVSLEIAQNVPDGKAVHVEPLTEDDWEIIELHAGFLEENLLSQLRAVYIGQVITVWIMQRTVVRLKAVELEPDSFCIKLLTSSEVIVAPKTRRTAVSQPTELNGIIPSSYVYPSYLRILIGNDNVKLEKSLERFDVAIVDNAIWQKFRQDSNSDIASICLVGPVFTSEETKEVEKVNNFNASGGGEVPNASASNLHIHLVGNSNIPAEHIVISPSLAVTLRARQFDLLKLSKPFVEKVQIKHIIMYPIQKSMESSGFTEFSKDVILDYFSTLAQDQDLVLTNKMQITVPTGNNDDIADVILVFKSMNSLDSFSVLNKQQLGLVSISFGPFAPLKDRKKESTFSVEDPLPPLASVDELLTNCLKHIEHRRKNSSLRPVKSTLGGILICGNRGAGKSIIVKHIAKTAASRFMTYCHFVECGSLMEDRVSIFKDRFIQWFKEATWHAPSLLVLDDLEHIIPAEVEHADSFRSRQLAECFLQIAQKALQKHDIVLLATSQQQQSLHPLLISSHLFSDIVVIKPPQKRDRRLILDLLITNSGCLNQDVDTAHISGETEGYLPADLKALVDRSVHEAAVRVMNTAGKDQILVNGVKTDHGDPGDVDSLSSTTSLAMADDKRNQSNDSQISLSSDDLSNALKGFTPISLRGVKLQKSDVRWEDIGGLNETRQVLLETLEWPSKYAAIFSRCPLRLRSGLLLYGYPGCGKTLIASAVARECGLNFISVKGPELLNKYIGASEKSVRDLFERASAAKPCVLFFDEFDSIAPKRGHDSTGVTDRVVNQMLTQMDGAEGLDGVYVLAATSRPDLIDPALLRPGRLDKSLLCDMPSLSDRIEILRSLSRKLDFADDIDFLHIARNCEGYSGADLQAVLYNAHLAAIHETINLESTATMEINNGINTTDSIAFSTTSSKIMTRAEKGKLLTKLEIIAKNMSDGMRLKMEGVNTKNSHQQVKITKENLAESLETTRPSITIDERRRLHKIYKEFISGRSGEYKSGTASEEIGGRTSLM